MVYLKVLSKNQSLLFLVVLAIALRLGTYSPLVIDHDESTYIIIADQWLKGYVPYVDFIEVKPIGIFLLFASILKCYSTVWLIRIVAAVVIGLTGYLLAQCADHFFKDRFGFYSGILYVFTASLHKWSWSANTELFFLFFSIWGLYFLIRSQKMKSVFIAGLIFGLGVLFKYHILFDVMAFSLCFICKRKSVLPSLGKLGIMSLGLVLPVGIWMGSYYYLGHLDELVSAIWTIPSKYASTVDFLASINFIGEFYLSFLPLSALFFAGIYDNYRSKKIRPLIFCLIWLCCSWIGVLATGKHYFHYLFQALPCLCFFLPFFFTQLRAGLRLPSWTSKGWTLSLIASLLVILPNANQFFSLGRSPKYLRQVAEMMRPNLTADAYIYTNHQNLIYYLTGTTPPSKFVHTSLLYKPDLTFAFDIDPAKEFEKIIAKRPIYYLFQGNIPDPFAEEIRSSYQEVFSIDDQTKLYQVIP